MNYKLVVLTHGQSPTLQTTLNSFFDNVYPKPADQVLVEDGPPHKTVEWWGERRSTRPERTGFCNATAYAWGCANEGDHDYVFWLEDDFVFERKVDLTALRNALVMYPSLCQMALMRQAVNEQEIKAGGIVASRPGQFIQNGSWMQHRSYWTTNPSLFPRWVVEDYEWPTVKQCEGHFGIMLREHGYYFGYWGTGEPWVRHIGVRRGHGY